MALVSGSDMPPLGSGVFADNDGKAFVLNANLGYNSERTLAFFRQLRETSVSTEPIAIPWFTNGSPVACCCSGPNPRSVQRMRLV